MKEYETELRILRTALYDAARDLADAADGLRFYTRADANEEAERADAASRIARNAANRAVR